MLQKCRRTIARQLKYNAFRRTAYILRAAATFAVVFQALLAFGCSLSASPSSGNEKLHFKTRFRSSAPRYKSSAELNFPPFTKHPATSAAFAPLSRTQLAVSEIDNRVESSRHQNLYRSCGICRRPPPHTAFNSSASAADAEIRRYDQTAEHGASPIHYVDSPPPSNSSLLNDIIHNVDKTLKMDPSTHNHVASLKKILKGEIMPPMEFLKQWPANERRDVDIFATSLEPNAAIVPGQKTALTIPVNERHRIPSSFKQNKAPIIFIGWIEQLRHDASPNAATLVGHGGIATVTDVKLLDKSGEIEILIVGRCKILNVIRVKSDECRVAVIPHRDELKAYKNAELTGSHIRGLHAIYDRCNRVEAVYRELRGEADASKAAEWRLPLHLKVNELIGELDNPSEQEIAEVVSFCAMDYHIDAKARCWASELQDTEIRLDVVREALDDKIRKVEAEIRRIRSE